LAEGAAVGEPVLDCEWRRAREAVLKQLPRSGGVRLLDVAIGDGVYTKWHAADWSIIGVDVSMIQLAACQRRNGDRDLRLILCEAEDLPFADKSFDAVLSNGGFNCFSDPERP
jgi:ubiquinone/menaquinone biosynthesis C-methylase UbiE